MTFRSEILALHDTTDTLLIGPRVAFGRGGRLALESADEVRARLLRLLRDPGALASLRRSWERWEIGGDRLTDTSDRSLIDRVADATLRGRLAAYVVPDSSASVVLRPNAEKAVQALRSADPQGAPQASTSVAPITARSAPTRPSDIALAAARRPLTRSDAPLAPPAARLRVDTLSLEARLVLTLQRTGPRLAPEPRTAFTKMLQPAALAKAVAVLAVWTRPHTGLGLALHAVRAGMGPFVAGRDVLEAVDTIQRLLEKVRTAAEEQDLEEAAALLAQVIGLIGAPAFLTAIEHGGLRVSSPGRAAGGRARSDRARGPQSIGS